MDLKVFKKEKCELISRKAEIDDFKTSGKIKTTITKESHKVMNTNADNDLLGLRTGLTNYVEKPKREFTEKRPVEEKPRKVSGE